MRISIRVGKVNLRSELFCLGKIRKIWSVVHSNCLEYLAEERLSEVLTELLHRCIERLAGLSGDANCKVVLCFLFQQCQNNRLLAFAFSHHCITFPVANLQPGRCNFGSLIYGCSVCFFALSGALQHFFRFKASGSSSGCNTRLLAHISLYKVLVLTISVGRNSSCLRA